MREVTSVAAARVSLAHSILEAIDAWCSRNSSLFCRLYRAARLWEPDELSRLLEDVGDARIYVSGGSPENWSTSIGFYLESGLLPWGCNSDNIDAAKRGGPHWKSLISDLARGAPVINIYYVSYTGVLGAGLIIHAEVDPAPGIWANERCGEPNRANREKCYVFRWYTLPIWIVDEAERLTDGEAIVETVRGFWSRRGSAWSVTGRSCLQSVTDREILAQILAELAVLLREWRPPRIPSSVEVREEGGGRVAWTPGWSSIDVGRFTRQLYERLLGLGLYLPEELVRLFLSALSAGNVLLLGPPGSGKTLLAVEAGRLIGAKVVAATLHAGWTRFELIGGPVLEAGRLVWKSGVLLQAILEAVRGNLVLLVLDEVNRGDADRAFAEFYTAFSSPYPHGWRIAALVEQVCREAAAYGGGDETVRMLCGRMGELEKARDVLRIVATMNTVDYATLYTVGEAFSRRFLKVIVSPDSSPETIRREVEAALRYARRQCENLVVADEALLERLVEVLSGLRREASLPVSPLPLGPGLVRDAILAAAAYGGCRLDRRALCKGLESYQPVSTLVSEEAGRRWRMLLAKLGCGAEGG